MLLVVDVGVTFVFAIFRFGDVVADANGGSLDKTPLSDNLGWKLDFKINLTITISARLCIPAGIRSL